MKKTGLVLSMLLLVGWMQESWAQSTTGGQSGGSTASTGAGYLTPGKRPATSKAASMSINDEGASRGYMYVPPSQRSKGLKKTRAASPDGTSGMTPTSGKPATGQATPKNPKRTGARTND